MTDLPALGDLVHVWPALDLRVLDGSGRAVPPEGRDVTWDAWWHRRFLEGALHLHDPRAPKGPKR